MKKISLGNMSAKKREFVAEFGEKEYEFTSPKLGKLMDVAAKLNMSVQEIAPSGDLDVYAQVVHFLAGVDFKKDFKTYKDFLDSIEDYEAEVLTKVALVLLGIDLDKLEEEIDKEKKVTEVNPEA